MPNPEKKCPNCGGPLADNGTIVHEEIVAGARFRVTMPAMKCRRCGTAIVSARALATKELRIAERLLRGPANGEALRYARKALGFRAMDLAEFLRDNPSTISRWENGSTVDRAAWLFLWSLVKLRLSTGVDVNPPKEEALADESIDLSAA